MMINIKKIRSEFPQLENPFEGNVITYFDSAATTLKPKAVVEAVNTYYTKECANIHRGVHTLSEVSTVKYERTRKLLKKFINAKKESEIVFTKGTTDSLNLLAYTLGQSIQKDDEIIISTMEHHSNIVPWQLLCQRTGAKLRVAPIDDNGDIIIEEFNNLLNDKTKIVSIVGVSNSLGTVNPIKKLLTLTRKTKAKFILDAAQMIAHQKIDVQSLDVDFMAFSGHKMFGPTGVGVLYGKFEELDRLPPFQGGGDMINKVSFEKTTYNTLPQRLEAGTPNIAGVIGLAPAIELINSIGIDNIEEYEKNLFAYALEKFKTIKGLNIIGNPQQRSGVIAFTTDGLHPHDIATFLNKYHIAVRTGHHCTQPLLKRLGVSATARASFGLYNTKEEVDHLVVNLEKIIELFC